MVKIVGFIFNGMKCLWIYPVCGFNVSFMYLLIYSVGGGTHVQVRRQLAGVDNSLLLLLDFQGVNLGCQVWLQVPSPIRSSHWPCICALIRFIKIHKK